MPLTRQNASRLGIQVDLVLPGDTQHHGFGPPVVLGGKQPAQRLRKKPGEGKRAAGRAWRRRARREQIGPSNKKKKPTEVGEEGKQ